MPDAPPEDKRPPWLRKLLTLPGVLGLAAATTVVSFAATEGATWVRSLFTTPDPVAISVELDPSRIAGMVDVGLSGVIPREVRTTGNPGDGCDGFVSWLRRNNGVDVGLTRLQVIVQGQADSAVLLSGMRVRMLDRRLPLQGTGVSCPTQGEAQLRAIAVDLDARPPAVTYADGSAPFAFTVSKGETEAFNISATGDDAYYRWLLELDIVVDGVKSTRVIGDERHPFETTGRTSVSWWSWDYQSTWFLEVDDGPAPPDVPSTVAADQPLPPLPEGTP